MALQEQTRIILADEPQYAVRFSKCRDCRGCLAGIAGSGPGVRGSSSYPFHTDARPIDPLGQPNHIKVVLESRPTGLAQQLELVIDPIVGFTCQEMTALQQTHRPQYGNLIIDDQSPLPRSRY